MKKLLIFAIAILPFFAFAQQTIDVKDVPGKYSKDFERLYPNASKAQWYQIDSATYEVKFISNDMNTSILFKNISMETRWEVNPEYVPASIKSYIDSTYNNSKIEYAYIVDIAKAKGYEVGIKQKKDHYLLSFEIDGKYKEAVKQEPVVKKKAKKAKK